MAKGVSYHGSGSNVVSLSTHTRRRDRSPHFYTDMTVSLQVLLQCLA